MDTTRLAAFVAAADAGSLSRAARELGAQLSTVSRHVAELEADLGVPLLVRTGRGVRLTPAGERYLERARHVLRELAAAAADARGEGAGAPASLRISVPIELSLRLLPEVIVELAASHPALTIDVHSDARRVSLLEEDYDAAVRLGPLRSSELVARRLGQVSLVLCARPDVAQGIRSVADVKDAEHALVAGARTEVSGTLRGKSVRWKLAGRCRVSTFSEAAELAARSPRLVVLPSFTAAEHLLAGRLARVLPTLALPRIDVHEVHPARHRGSTVLRELGDLLAAALDRAERSLHAPTRASRP